MNCSVRQLAGQREVHLLLGTTVWPCSLKKSRNAWRTRLPANPAPRPPPRVSLAAEASARGAKCPPPPLLPDPCLSIIGLPIANP